MASFKDTIFSKAPLFVKGALLGLHSAIHRRDKYGSGYATAVSWLRSNRLLGPTQVDLMQISELKSFLRAVYTQNGWYRAEMEAFSIDLRAIDNNPVKALMSLRILEKQFLKANLDKLVSDESIATFFVSSTSGTTGSPMQIPYDIDGYQKGFAYWRRFYDEMGLPEKFKNARFSGRVLLGSSARPKRFWVEDWFERRLFMSTYHLTSSNLPKYIEKLNKYKPLLIDGYPSAIVTIAKYIIDSGKPLSFRPRAVATTAETLSDVNRDIIEAAFGCKVYNQYASSEGAPFITECGDGGFHLNLDTGYFEFLDIPGSVELKEMVVTSFRNVKLPLIRYRIGDTARLAQGGFPSACACGSPFPTISGIEGRVDDILYTTERGAIGRLDPIYKGVVGIQKSQIIQVGVDKFNILVEAGEGYCMDTVNVLEKNFRDRVGSTVTVEVTLVDAIPLTSSGKFKAVINRTVVR